MHIILTGINHQTAPVGIREKIAISSGQLAESLLVLHSRISHSIILSTCNRTEIYTVSSESGTTSEGALDFFKTRLGIPDDDFLKLVYTLRDRAALEHLFRVISGLESQVIGEYEILGQVRQAIAVAEKVGMVDLPLRFLFNSAIRVGRRVREATGISKNAVSVSSVAVDLAAGVIGDLTKCQILVIGMGEAGQLAARVAREKGASQIVVVSRTLERALAASEILKARPLELANLENELSRTDIVIACSGAPHRVLRVKQVEKTMLKRPQTPLVIIDIAMPRNVEPEVDRIPNVFTYNLDDLTTICDVNRKLRENAVQHANTIIREEINKFIHHWHDFETRPIITALMSKAEEIRSAQMEKTLKKLPPMSNEQRNNLEAMTKSIMTKILQDPIEFLKANGKDNNQDIIKKMFKLGLEDQT